MICARCPACQTVFRVRPEQLRAHHGEVRCGRCHAAFNALEHLLDENAKPAAASTPPPPGTEIPHDATAASLDTASPPLAAPDPAPADEFFVLEERPSVFGRKPHESTSSFQASDASASTSVPDLTAPGVTGSPSHRTAEPLDFEIPDSLLVPRRPLRTSDLLRREPLIGEPAIEPLGEKSRPAGAPVDPGETSFPEFIDLPDIGPAEPSGNAEYASEPHFGTRVPFGEWAKRVRSEPGLANEAAPPIEPGLDDHAFPSPAADASVAVDVAAETDTTDDATAAGPAERETAGEGEAPEADEPSSPPDLPPPADALEAARLDATYGAPSAPPVRRALLGLGIGILLGALTVQAAYLFRAEITRAWPQLRPVYLAACEPFRCTIPLPRLADRIGIETSDLQSEAGRPGRFILNATVRNRAPHPQAYPHLELTLTDAQDRPAVRRVLTPQEWVPPAQLARAGLRAGFPAGREIALKVPFEAEGVAAVGYRLYVFYP